MSPAVCSCHVLCDSITSLVYVSDELALWTSILMRAIMDLKVSMRLNISHSLLSFCA